MCFNVLRFVFNNVKKTILLARMSTESSSLLTECKKLVPTMSETSHKGTSGRIGICGGSVEFTGAPYFSGISALRTGADLVYVFSASSAAPVIKSYSPELMVLPYLNADDAVNLIFPWLKRLHALVIGPGLGRNETVFNNVHELLKLLTLTPADNGTFRPLIIDADGLHFLSHNIGVFKDYPGDVYLTPNCVEFNNLVHAVFGHNYQEPTESILSRLSGEIGKNVTIILKGNIDIISNRHKQLICSNKGSLRRCGGQGDVLSGIVATFAAWTGIRKWQDAPVIHKEYSDNMLAAYSACYLTRECSRIAYETHSRSMLVTDMIKELPKIFSTYFG
ncbi:NAD(P)HX dehydratase [Rhodnius prolixus]